GLQYDPCRRRREWRTGAGLDRRRCVPHDHRASAAVFGHDSPHACDALTREQRRQRSSTYGASVRRIIPMNIRTTLVTRAVSSSCVSSHVSIAWHMLAHSAHALASGQRLLEPRNEGSFHFALRLLELRTIGREQPVAGEGCELRRRGEGGHDAAVVALERRPEPVRIGGLRNGEGAGCLEQATELAARDVRVELFLVVEVVVERTLR